MNTCRTCIEPLSYESYSENQIFQDSLSARLPVAGTIPRGHSLYEYEDTNEGYDLAKLELRNLCLMNFLFTKRYA